MPSLDAFAAEQAKPVADRDLIIELEKRGFIITKDAPSERQMVISDQPSGTVRFSVASDTHLGHKHQQLTHWRTFMDHAREWGSEFWLHGGDIVDGGHMHRDQEFELFRHGADAQGSYAAENIPKLTNKRGKVLPGYVIGGNHDGSFWNDAGANVLKRIVQERPDLHILGAPAAYFHHGPLKIYLLHPDGGPSYARCFSADTEILSEDGWVAFTDLRRGARVATLGPDGSFEWQVPTDYTTDHVDGELLRFSARTFDLLVTEDHDLYVRRYPGYINRRAELSMPQKSHRRLQLGWHKVPASEVAEGHRQQWQMKSAADSWAGHDPGTVDIPGFGRVASMDAAQLVAWYVTEGHVKRRNRVGRRPAYTTISQYQSVNPGNHEAIALLVGRLGLRPGISTKAVHIYNAAIASWLVDQCGEGSRSKHLPGWVKELPREQLGVVLGVLVAGDGWSRGCSWGYKSISSRLRDDVQEMAIKAGYGANVCGDTVSLRTVQNEPTINGAPERVAYVGDVHCVSVPNGVVLVRRNGKAIWSGNSYRLQKIVEQLAPDTKPNILLAGHWHVTAHVPGYRNVEAFALPCFQAQTAYLRRKGLAPVIGGLHFEAEYNERGLLNLTTRWDLFRTTVSNDYP